jgi:hypothetical protein
MFADMLPVKQAARYCLLGISLVIAVTNNLQAQTNTDIATPGQPLPAWKEGYLDLHHINTGRGNASYYILPDGTTILFDAGEMDPSHPRTTSKRNTVLRPNESRQPYEWIARYIQQVAPSSRKAAIDYAVISHFHDDHFGSWYPSAPLSTDKSYALTGITGVGGMVPVRNLLIRDTTYPVPMSTLLARYASGETHFVKTWQNLQQYMQTEKRQHGMQVQPLKAGSRTQIAMQYKPAQFPNCYVQNVKSNGWIWTGKDSAVVQHFPTVDPGNSKTWPDENSLSNVLTINYGPFIYYTGGDCGGNVFLGDAAWRDVETPVAKAIGQVEVATMDHHGNRDAVNEFQIKTFQPQVWIQQVWTADHPGHEVLIRVTSPHLYTAKRDLFATNMMEPTKLVIGPLIDRAYASQQGHIVVRVLPGGKSYYVITMDDSREDMPVVKVVGPYTSRQTTTRN